MAKKESTKKTVVYDETSIEYHEGLDGIRMRPTMYMGVLGERGVLQLFREVIDNCFDEAKEGYCSDIFVVIDEKKHQIMVQDTARGIPLGKLKDLITKVHAGK